MSVQFACQEGQTHSNPTILPIMCTRDGTAAAPGSGVNRFEPGALDSGLICRRLEKLGTSEAELRGIGPGDMVGWREVRCDDVRNMFGGSGNTASAGGAAPVVSSVAQRHHSPRSHNPVNASHSHGSSVSAFV